jgi:hypothetical protein
MYETGVSDEELGVIRAIEAEPTPSDDAFGGSLMRLSDYAEIYPAPNNNYQG